MNELLIQSSSITSGLNIWALDVLTILALISGILVITSKNPVLSILYLISLFVIISSYIILLGINFIGLTYILVYVGAIAILFLFIIMLLNIKISEYTDTNKNNLPLGTIIGLLFLLPIYSIMPHNLEINNLDWIHKVFNGVNSLILPNTEIVNITSNDSLYSLNNSNWLQNIHEYNQIKSIGSIFYTHSAILLVVTSIILLLALIGSIKLILTTRPNNEIT